MRNRWLNFGWFASWLLLLAHSLPANEPPTLVFANPENGATGVAASSPVLFVFSEDMLATHSIEWSASVDASRFTYSWLDTSFLQCTYSGGFPGNTTVTWKLNPSSRAPGFFSVDGVPLPSDIFQGQFTTGGSGGGNNCNNPNPQPTNGFTILKSLNFVQNSAAQPVPDPQKPASFLLALTSTAANPATAVTLKFPNGTSKTIPNVIEGYFIESQEFASQAAMDTAYPQGNYTLDIQRRDGSTVSRTVPIPAGNYPPTPRIANYDETQAINAAADFTVRWNSFTGAGATDSISLQISDQSGGVFMAPDPCVPRTLANTATSVVIPANTLRSAQAYDGMLCFYSFSNLANNTDFIGSVGLVVCTHLNARASGSGPAAPRFSQWNRLADRAFHLRVTASAGRSYVLEGTTDFTFWIPLLTTNPPAGDFEFTDREAPALAKRFYRVRAP